MGQNLLISGSGEWGLHNGERGAKSDEMVDAG
jgi:hypothetical protein